MPRQLFLVWIFFHDTKNDTHNSLNGENTEKIHAIEFE